MLVKKYLFIQKNHRFVSGLSPVTICKPFSSDSLEGHTLE